jgi:hypothetical protein
MTALLLLASAAEANDGRDRYQTGYPNLFHHLMGPIADGAGFRVLPQDMPSGADGDPAYRWAQQHALDLMQVCARRTVVALGEANYSMAVFDLSAENGDTPVGFDSPTGPRGRHPGGSHDGGLNLDLGYYLTDLTGLEEKEDYAACTNQSWAFVCPNMTKWA